MKTISTLAVLLCTALQSHAQLAITNAIIDTTSATSGLTYSRPRAYQASSSALPSSSNYQYKFGNQSGYSDNIKTVKSFTAGGAGYTYSTGITSIVKIRRVENTTFNTYWSGYGTPETTPTPRDLAYYEARVESENDNGWGDNEIKVKAPYTPKMEDLFQSNNIAIGIDNLFANDAAVNFNNVERIDVVVPAGQLAQVPSAQGFAIFERGVYNEHDPCVVALITAIDNNNNPTAYATQVIRIDSSDYYNASFTANKVYQPSAYNNGYWVILRRDSSAARLRASDLVLLDQGIGGALIRFSDFGIAPGTTVYGYSLLAGDFPASGTGANVVDYTNTAYFPTNTSNNTLKGGNDMSVITGIVKMLSISGKVFYDADGLNDNAIDGSGIGLPSGQQLYVNLVDANGKVVGATSVHPTNGTYQIDQLAFGPLTAQLCTVKGVVGNNAPAAGIPSGWVSVGESYGTNNLAGSGFEGGTPNAVIPVSIGDQNITNLNFAIERPPLADEKNFNLSIPLLGLTLTLNNPLLFDQLTGSDPEDGPGIMGLNGNSGNRTVVITALPDHGTLWYDGNEITAPGFVIPNYNKNLLNIVFPNNDNGLITILNNPNSTSFSYAYRDAAGAQSAPASYNATWLAPLPVTLLSFTARAVANDVQLSWRTAMERNNLGFYIERSKDGAQWTSIGFKSTSALQGNSDKEINYSYTDNDPLEGINYYRLRQTDIDDKIAYSNIQSVIVNISDEIIVYPNPASDKIYLQIKDWSKIAEVRIVDIAGKTIRREHNRVAYLELNIPAGVYYLQFVNNNGEMNTYKFSKR